MRTKKSGNHTKGTTTPSWHNADVLNGEAHFLALLLRLTEVPDPTVWSSFRMTKMSRQEFNGGPPILVFGRTAEDKNPGVV